MVGGGASDSSIRRRFLDVRRHKSLRPLSDLAGLVLLQVLVLLYTPAISYEQLDST